MSKFLADLASKGFGWVFSVSLLVGYTFRNLGQMCGEKNPVLGALIEVVPSVLFSLYIWYVRRHVFWLIWASLPIIVFILSFVLTLRGHIMKTKK
jgi:hypothetical protein